MLERWYILQTADNPHVATLSKNRVYATERPFFHNDVILRGAIVKIIDNKNHRAAKIREQS